MAFRPPVELSNTFDEQRIVINDILSNIGEGATTTAQADSIPKTGVGTRKLAFEWLSEQDGVVDVNQMIIFKDTIDNDITIGATERGLAVDPTVADGTTVTVSNGGVFAVV